MKFFFKTIICVLWKRNTTAPRYHLPPSVPVEGAGSWSAHVTAPCFPGLLLQITPTDAQRFLFAIHSVGSGEPTLTITSHSFVPSRKDHHGNGSPVPLGVLDVNFNHRPLGEKALDKLCGLAPVCLPPIDASMLKSLIRSTTLLLLDLGLDRDHVGVLGC